MIGTQTPAPAPLVARDRVGLRPARSEQGDAVGFEALAAVDDLDANPLTGVERLDSAAAQHGDMNKHVLAAAVGRDEAIALVGLEPLDRAFQGFRWPHSASVAAHSRLDRGAEVDGEDRSDQRAFRAGA